MSVNDDTGLQSMTRTMSMQALWLTGMCVSASLNNLNQFDLGMIHEVKKIL